MHPYFLLLSYSSLVAKIVCHPLLSRFPSWELKVMNSNIENSLSACKGKGAYIYPPQTPSDESLVHWATLLGPYLLTLAKL